MMFLKSKFLLFALGVISLFGCKKEPLDYNPLEGDWYLQAIEWNTGGIEMENPYKVDDDEFSVDRSEFSIPKNQIGFEYQEPSNTYFIGSAHFGGSHELFAQNKCKFQDGIEFPIELGGDYAKWKKKVRNLITRVDRYEVSEKELLLKSEFKQLRFIKN